MIKTVIEFGVVLYQQTQIYVHFFSPNTKPQTLISMKLKKKKQIRNQYEHGMSKQFEFY